MAQRFGREIFEDFTLKKDHTHCNHGSYGAIPKTLQDKRIEMIKEFDNCPDIWFRQKRLPLWRENAAFLAKYFNGKAEDVVLVTNATLGVNCAIKSLPLKSGDTIVANSWTYRACFNALDSAAKKMGAQIATMEIPFPLESEDQLISAYTDFLEKQPNVKFILLDLISSASATLFPWRKLVKLFKEKDVYVMLDAAHAPGQVDINFQEMEELGVDFFVGNLHKWMYCPKSCAIFWSHPRTHSFLAPVLTSHLYTQEDYREDFAFQGTVDDIPMLMSKDSVEYYESLGGREAISKYITNLLDEASEYMVRTFGTKAFPIPKTMEAPFMRIFRLPDAIFEKYPLTEAAKTNVFSDIHGLMETLLQKYKITSVCLYVHQEPWIRLSGQIYNTMDDYRKLAEALQDILKS